MHTVIAHTFEYSPAFRGGAATRLLSDRQEVTPHMAGHRQRAGQPLKAVQRVLNRRHWHQSRLADAIEPGDRVAAVAEGVRSALKLLEPSRAGELAELFVERGAQVMEDAYTDAINGRRRPDDRRY